ncbi:MAG: flagellar export protein FliJ [Deltaproteobacteria bacterium]|nr:MAG: flagellar export protein FliJ [Deltaproteobacteria bacterium]
MKPFSFRLDSILNYRDYLEKRAQRDLFNARNEYMERVKAVKRLAKERVEIARRCRDEGFRGIDVPLYQIYISFLQRLEHDIERAHMSLKKGEEKVKAQEAVLKKESIKKKTLELLKDLQLKRRLERLEREEQKQMDELVIIRRGVRG